MDDGRVIDKIPPQGKFFWKIPLDEEPEEPLPTSRRVKFFVIFRGNFLIFGDFWGLIVIKELDLAQFN